MFPWQLGRPDSPDQSNQDLKEEAYILYVEDDETIAYLTRDNLELRGYRLDHVENGVEVYASIMARRDRASASFSAQSVPSGETSYAGKTLAEVEREMLEELRAGDKYMNMDWHGREGSTP